MRGSTFQRSDPVLQEFLMCLMREWALTSS